MQLNIFQWQSLRTRVTLLTLAIFVIGIWSLSLYGRWILREDMTRRLAEQQLSTARIVAAAINSQLDLRFQALDEAAKVVAPFMLNRASLQTEFDQQTALTLLFNGGAIVLGPDGTTIADLPLSAGRIGNNYLDKEWNRAVLKEGKSTIGQPIIGKVLGMPIFSMAVPIRDSRGKVIGALSGVVNLGKPNFLDVIANSNYGATGDVLLVAPQYRLIITASDKRRIMEQLAAPGVNPALDRRLERDKSTNFFVNARGIEVLASSSVIPVSGWQVVVSLPAGEAFAPIRKLQQRVLLITLLLTLLAGGLTWWILRRQLSPLTDAATTLTKFSNSEQPLGALPVVRQDEVGKLIEGFNGLLGTLKQREDALRGSETRFRSLARLGLDWYYEQDGELRYTRFDGKIPDQYRDLFDKFLGKRPWEIGHDCDGGWDAFQRLTEARLPLRDFVHYRVRRNGTRRYFSDSADPVFDATGQFVGYQGVGRDITVQKVAEELVHHRATHDSLTGLPNRAMFSALLEQALRSAKRRERKLAIFFIDLDGFKVVNDLHGHGAGDSLLRQMAVRFRDAVRTSDVVVRLGGDEFVVLAQELAERDGVSAIAKKLLDAAALPVQVAGRECRVSASIGISVFPDDGNDENSLMKNADQAMYAAKREGKNAFRCFS